MLLEPEALRRYLRDLESILLLPIFVVTKLPSRRRRPPGGKNSRIKIFRMLFVSAESILCF
jgi:hypothetical protein